MDANRFKISFGLCFQFMRL